MPAKSVIAVRQCSTKQYNTTQNASNFSINFETSVVLTQSVPYSACCYLFPVDFYNLFFSTSRVVYINGQPHANKFRNFRKMNWILNQSTKRIPSVHKVALSLLFLRGVYFSLVAWWLDLWPPFASSNSRVMNFARLRWSSQCSAQFAQPLSLYRPALILVATSQNHLIKRKKIND